MLNLLCHIMPRIACIVNPAGRDGHALKRWKSIEPALAEAGFEDLEEGLAINKTQSAILLKEIELLKIQIEEIKISTSNPLTN